MLMLLKLLNTNLVNTEVDNYPYTNSTWLNLKNPMWTYREVVNLLFQFSSSQLQRPDMCHRVTVVVISIVTMAVVTGTTLFRRSAEEAYNRPGGQKKRKQLSNAQNDHLIKIKIVLYIRQLLKPVHLIKMPLNMP